MASEAMLGMLTIKASTRVFALGVGSDIARDLHALYDMLQNLSQGHGPEPADVGRFTQFFKQIVHAMADFYSMEDEKADKYGKLKKHVLYGGEAIQATYVKVAAQMEAQVLGRETLLLMKPLKTYAWLLDDTQRTNAKCWIQKKKTPPQSLTRAEPSWTSARAPSLHLWRIRGQRIGQHRVRARHHPATTRQRQGLRRRNRR